MKAEVLDINGKKVREITLPGYFSEKVRGDLITKVIEAQKTKQPYAPSPVAGKQHSASGIINKRRHVWKSSYGRGISRVPRKIISQRGSQFNWIGAEISGTVGGRRAHPPKILGMINTKRINKKEKIIAFKSALSATADEKFLIKKYETLSGKKVKGLPFIVEGKITELKTKQFLESLKKILGELYNVALQKKKVRKGAGKLRGRKYKKNAGILIVTGEKEKMKVKGVEVTSAKKLGVYDLANGEPGRLTVYTENAVKELNDRLKETAK